MNSDWLARRAQLSPLRVALLDAADGLRPINYAEWNAAVNRTAHLLIELGVRRGERVAILAHNSVAFLDLWFACGKLGAILQPLNWRLTAHELAALVADGTPCVIVYDSACARLVETLRAQVPTVRHFIALHGETHGTGDVMLGARENMPSTPPPPIELGSDDPWVICYTGGTTGLPKGAVITHSNVIWNAVNTAASWGLTPDDVAILNAPLFHSGGLNVFTAPLAHIGGASIVCEAFDCDQVFDLIERAGVTVFFGVPTMFIAMQQHPRWHEADFSRLRFVISGGAPCPMPVFERFWQRGVEFKTGYDLTEAGPNTFWLPREQVRTKPGAVGIPLMHVDLQILRSNSETCLNDEPGELYIRGPQVCAGYWNRPEETAQTFVDGWLRTGDLATVDDGGCFRIVGRIKDVIISGGENIYPAEVESVLTAHPAVAEAALVGVADTTWGEIGCAIVVPKNEVSAEAILVFCAERLARYKLPKQVLFAETLPRTGAGKIDKQALKAQFGLKGI